MKLAMLAQTWLVVVSGLSGDPARRASLEQHAGQLVAAAGARLAVEPAHIVRLGEGTTPAVSAEQVRRTLADVAARAQPNATVVIVLLGHGSALGGEPRFNLPGPDLTAAEFARALEPLRTQEVVVVVATSASGPWAAALAGPRRAVITATRSATERDETVFARYLVEAVAGEGGDADRNGRLSVAELFEYARQGVERHYRDLRRLRTEHALLDDNGDGRGSLAATDSGDGSRAATLYLNGAPDAAGADAALAPLFARRDSLECAVAALRARRAAVDSAAYERELERLLLDLAQVGRTIRERRGPANP